MHTYFDTWQSSHMYDLPAAYAEMFQVISLDETVLIFSNTVEIFGIILKIVQNGHNCTFLVVWE